ncbi:hypothetical protein ACLESO_15275 [Pyxidicoccus sp. 3LG]
MLTRSLRGLAALLAAASFLACSDSPENTPDAGTSPPADSGTDSGTPGDGGTDDAGSGVSFRPIVHTIDENGQVSVGQVGAWLDFPEPAALVPGGLDDGGVKVYAARHVGGGYFIPDVPQGHYLLRFNDTHLWTDARQVELRHTMVQRPSLEWEVPAGTALDLSISGLAPWNEGGDMLRLSAPNGGPVIEDLRLSAAVHFGGSPPAPGATQVDVRVSQFFTRLDGARGDSLWVQQLSEIAGIDGEHPYKRVVRSFHQPAVPFTPGQVTPLAVALSGGTERMVSFSLDRTAFAQQLRGGHPEASGLTSMAWSIGARPGAEPFARYPNNPELAFAYVYDTEPLVPFDVSFLDAFPGHWRRVASVATTADVRLTSSSGSFTHLLSLQRHDTLEEVGETGTLAPRLGPVRNLRINGQGATGELTGVGVTPTVSWDPPALGTATRYFVQVTPLVREGQFFSEGVQSPAIATSTTELRLPPGWVSGTHFVVKVTATRGAGTRSPTEGMLPLDLAEASTGILSP